MYNTNISKEILCWYDKNKRDLPWRKTNDPYKIWLSEVMLQQTKVETVIPYYNNWLKNYKTIQSVAQANLDELLKIWEGMGYYSRCKNFYHAAKEIIYKYFITNNFLKSCSVESKSSTSHFSFAMPDPVLRRSTLKDFIPMSKAVTA